MKIFPIIALGILWMSVNCYPGPIFSQEEHYQGKKGDQITELICQDEERFIIREREVMPIVNYLTATGDIIVVETRRFRLTLYRDGEILRSYPVAIGDPDTPSPIGEWKVIHKGGNWGNGFGVRWIGLNVPWGIYGIHGTDKPHSIGSRSSHGCIRMFNRHVLELYGLVKVGTPVYIIGTPHQVVPRKELARKNTGKDIVLLQFALRNAGFDPGAADGRFGEQMEQAIIRFQRYYGIATTGKITINEQILLRVRKISH